MNKVTTISALAVLAGIAIYDVGFRDEGSGGEAAEKRFSSVGANEDTGERRGREPLTRKEIVRRIPEKMGAFGSPRLTEEEKERMKIFEELGALDGEEAVDFLFEKYGKGHGTYLPMVFAMRGWMEQDMEGALAAFKGFLANGKPGFVHNLSGSGLGGNLFMWKGESFHSGYS